MAARTASGQPLHTNPPRCTMPDTRKFMPLMFMGSPPSGLSTRRSASTPPGRLFSCDNFFYFTKFFLRSHHCLAVPQAETRRRLVRAAGHPCQPAEND
jgi:hypothetical protein